jgi:mannosyltransferase OCH1-like enzyme
LGEQDYSNFLARFFNFRNRCSSQLDTYESCTWRNPSYQHILWTDEKSRTFLQENYPWFLDTYDSYPYTIQKVDAIRYFILYTYGGKKTTFERLIFKGIYTDLDVGCRKPSDHLLLYDLLLPETSPCGFSNDVLIAAPRHPFFKQLMEALPYWNHHFGSKYLTVMMSTGPLFVSYQFNIFQHKSNLTRVLPHELYGSRHSSFFYHTKGSSWHGSDAQFILWVYQNPAQLLIVAVVFVIVWLLLCTKYKSLRKK